MIAVVADAFHQLPSVVARDLDDDPEQLSLVCLSLLQYAQAYRAYDTAKGDIEKTAWKDSEIMSQVIQNAFDLHRERIARRRRG